MDADLLDDWLRLSLVPGLGPTLLCRCVDAMGSPRAVLEASIADLTGIRGIGRHAAPKIRTEIDRQSDGTAVGREKQLIHEHGIHLLTRQDDEYPPLLHHIPDPPPLLYVRGRLCDDDAISLAIVGARRCSRYGREQADRLATLCSQVGLCIVSGGAYGIDAAAHWAVLRVGERTVAVVGSGLARSYPEAHSDLFDQIASGHGAVVSELPMAFPPVAENFPRRNRIISGMALGVLVVEASLRSGALITARLCAEEHGREVMALSGQVDSPLSAGCHKMIREGWATLVTSVPDILDALGETGQLLKAAVTKSPSAEKTPSSAFEQKLTGSQRSIFQALVEPCGLDELSATTGLPVHTLQSDLTLLEIRGLVEKAGSVFNRR